MAARFVAERARGAISARGEFRFAVSGGRTPAAMFAALAEHDLRWTRVHIFQVDERIAPAGHPERNEHDLRRMLLDRVPAVAHLMDVDAPDLDRAAAAYAAVLAQHDPLDLVHLGLGDDGHTASWPPGDPVIHETARDVAIVGLFRSWRRMTITPPVVDRAREVLFLVTGADKAPALTRLLHDDPAIVASRVPGARATVITDLQSLDYRPTAYAC
jgi:6-phosphogluconolactonase